MEMLCLEDLEPDAYFSLSLSSSLTPLLRLSPPVYPSRPPSLYNITLPLPVCIMPVRHTAIWKASGP